jgi:hypothetical protein
VECTNKSGTGNTGAISRLRKYLSNIPEKHKIKELQQTTILGTAHILGKVKVPDIYYGKLHYMCHKL